jgi:hypothetical protein
MRSNSDGHTNLSNTSGGVPTQPCAAAVHWM